LPGFLSLAKERVMKLIAGRPWTLGSVFASCALAAAVMAQQQPAKQPEAAAHGAQPATAGTKAENPQQFLAKRAGEWNREIRFVGQPGGPGEPFSGTAKISAIHGGRFLLEEYSDVVNGRTVTGTRLFGYNAATGQYEAAFTGTTSPGILMLKGTSTDGGKVVDYSGEAARGDGSTFTLNVRVRQVDNDRMVMTFSMTGSDGNPNTFQETTYTRKK
jgi:hypothetical protein